MLLTRMFLVKLYSISKMRRKQKLKLWQLIPHSFSAKKVIQSICKEDKQLQSDRDSAACFVRIPCLIVYKRDMQVGCTLHKY